MRTRLACHRKRALRAVRRGFTLIELMLVVVIIGILVSFSYPYYTRFNARARGAEAQVVFNKLNAYFVNLFENNGSFAKSATGLYDPDPAAAALGQAANWDSTISGWTDVPFAFDGGLKMRYCYTTTADGSSMTITAVGSIPGLGPAILTGCASAGGLLGNYLLSEMLTGPSISTLEVPSM